MRVSPFDEAVTQVDSKAFLARRQEEAADDKDDWMDPGLHEHQEEEEYEDMDELQIKTSFSLKIIALSTCHQYNNNSKSKVLFLGLTFPVTKMLAKNSEQSPYLAGHSLNFRGRRFINYLQNLSIYGGSYQMYLP